MDSSNRLAVITAVLRIPIPSTSSRSTTNEATYISAPGLQLHHYKFTHIPVTNKTESSHCHSTDCDSMRRQRRCSKLAALSALAGCCLCALIRAYTSSPPNSARRPNLPTAPPDMTSIYSLLATSISTAPLDCSRPAAEPLIQRPTPT